MTTRVVLGPPGAGKTKAIATSIEAAIARGVEPDRILVVSFTRAAKEELLDRLRDALKHVGTVHGIAFGLLRLASGEILDGEAWAEFGRLHGYDLTDRTDRKSVV